MQIVFRRFTRAFTTHSGAGVSVPMLVLLTAFGVGVTAQGGYYLPGRFAIAVLVAVAVLAALWSRLRSPAEAWMAVWVCAALAVWAIVRAGMVGGYSSAASTVVTLGIIAGVLVILARTDLAARHLCGVALIGVGVLVALSGWIGVVWRRPPWGQHIQGLWRAPQP